MRLYDETGVVVSEPCKSGSKNFTCRLRVGKIIPINLTSQYAEFLKNKLKFYSTAQMLAIVKESELCL